MKHVFLLLGSNIGNRIEYIETAYNLISLRAGEIVLKSSVYETEPWGNDNQQPYLNSVIEINTSLQAIDLLNVILSIETELGRVRDGIENQPRTIDIDILFYGDEIIELPGLIIPHPRLQQRNFALTPLMEIAPNFKHPRLNKSISELHISCSDTLWVKKI